MLEKILVVSYVPVADAGQEVDPPDGAQREAERRWHVQVGQDLSEVAKGDGGDPEGGEPVHDLRGGELIFAQVCHPNDRGETAQKERESVGENGQGVER